MRQRRRPRPSTPGPAVSQRSAGERRTARATLHFTDVTEAERHPGDRLWHRRGHRRHRQRRLRRSLPDELRRQPAVAQQRRWHVHRRDGSRAARPTSRGSASRRRFSTTTATAGSISTSATTSTTASTTEGRARIPPARPITVRRRFTAACPIGCITTSGNGRFVDVTAKALVGGKFGPALGVSTADFNGDGWIDIFVANDGEDNLLWHQPEERHVQGDGARQPAWRSRPTARPKPAWASMPATSTTTATKISS